MKNRRVWELFPNRNRSATGLKRILPYKPLSFRQIENELNNIANNSERCVYIHVPFCNRACSFCGYYKCVNAKEDEIKQFYQKVIREIKRLSELAWVKSMPFKAIYFGGGTPTSMPAKLFFGILETITQYIPLSSDCEVTLESTISGLGEDYLEGFKKSLVNRISLGVQSFDEKLRRKNSRLAGAREVIEKIESSFNAGIENICVDLMYNLPGQTEKNWLNDLEKVDKMEITGCSVYPLLPFPNAPLVTRKKYQEPDPFSEYHLFKMADDFFMSLPEWQGFTAVQYGHKKKGVARYVSMQTDSPDILGLGPGAGGRVNGLEYMNAFSLSDYVHKETNPEKIRVFKPSEEYTDLFKLLVFFRKTEMDKTEFYKLIKQADDVNHYLYDRCLVKETGSEKKLTQDGKYWAANLSEMLINAVVKDS